MSSYALTIMSPSLVRAFVAMHGPAYVSNNAVEVWAAYLAANGGTGSRLPELEATWLSTRGAVGTSLRDLWGSYLNQQGYTGDIRQQMQGFFTIESAPITPPIVSPFDNLLNEDGFDFLLENGDALIIESVTESAFLLEDGGSLITEGVGHGVDDALVLE